AAAGRGDEGAWVAKLADEEALALLANVCREASKGAGFAVQPALDLAASEFFRNGKYRYRERTISPEEQVDFVERLVRDYGLFSVEDPFDQEDFGAFADLTRRIGDRCKVIGDDIFVTNVERLRRGIELRAGNAILIKPNQIGTLSETRAAVDLAHKSGFATVMSHRSGETTDDTIAHLAVAFGCLGIKTGAVGGEVPRAVQAGEHPRGRGPSVRPEARAPLREEHRSKGPRRPIRSGHPHEPESPGVHGAGGARRHRPGGGSAGAPRGAERRHPGRRPV